MAWGFHWIPAVWERYELLVKSKWLRIYQFETQTTPPKSHFAGCLESKIIWLFTYRFFPRNFLENKNIHPLVNPGNMVLSCVFLPIGKDLWKHLCVVRWQGAWGTFKFGSGADAICKRWIGSVSFCFVPWGFPPEPPPKNMCFVSRDHCVELRFTERWVLSKVSQVHWRRIWCWYFGCYIPFVRKVFQFASFRNPSWRN